MLVKRYIGDGVWYKRLIVIIVSCLKSLKVRVSCFFLVSLFGLGLIL